jgi:hydroxyethylthiazole kinase
MVLYKQESFIDYSQHAFPLPFSPLVQCITNEITCESMANALLYIDAKPVMADDIREFPEFFSQNNSLLLNLGHISKSREESLLEAARFAKQTDTPFVVDLVGAAATKRRYELGRRLSSYQPAVIKGNISEMRAYCGLKSSARGVDASEEEQREAAVLELSEAMKKEASENPNTVYLATGKYDLIVSKNQSFLLENGVQELDRFTGTGDIVGSLIAALLGANQSSLEATINAVSYFNLCGEEARKKTEGLADFRQETLNQLSLLMNQSDWYQQIRGGTI